MEPSYIILYVEPSYIPIVKVRLSSRDLVQKAVKQAGRLKRAGDGEYEGVYQGVETAACAQSGAQYPGDVEGSQPPHGEG